ncbi:hypothetical protein B0J14DRAFT_555004 [Halenospora varia]|nr:hypothetical protein B0J14DRAFT_555004 [Halenospora varia]
MEEQSRRFACDRCRGQKLRCERTQADTGTCKRCMRARVECVASPSSVRPPNDKRVPEKRRRSRGGGSSQASLMVANVGTTDQSPTPSYPSMVTLDFNADAGEYMQTGADSSTALDFRTSQDGRPEALVDQWRNISAVPALSTTSFPPERTNNGTSMARYGVHNGNDLTIGPGTNVFDFDAFFTHQDSSGSSGLTEAMTSDDSMDFVPNSFELAPRAANEECLQNLSDLSANLLQDLKRIRADDVRYSSETPQSQAGNERHNVGRMLEHSEKFLEILKHIGESAPAEIDMPDPSPAASSVRYYDLNGDDAHQTFGTTSRTTLSQLLGDGMASPPENQPSSSVRPLLNTKVNTGLIKPDIPTILAVLTCYTCLLRIYDAVFSHIHKSLARDPASQRKLLPPLPGLHLCGFKLEHHHNLQLEILARVSLHMLGRFEKVLDEIRRSCISSNALEESMAANLLTTIINQGLDTGEGGQSSEGLLKDITKSIRQLLDIKLAAV